MENILIYEKKFTEKIKIQGVDIINEEFVHFYLPNDGFLKISGHHSQDCCESVFADFSVIAYYKEALQEHEFSKLEIKRVKDMGFLICFEKQNNEFIKIFVPCYNCQNGYYSDDLSLIIETD